MRKLLAIVLIPVMILVFGPWVTGIWLKYQYEKMIALYNATGSFHIELKNYQRHWFNADVSLAVETRDTTIQNILTTLGMDEDVFPKKINFTIDQHIQHGPFIYHDIQNLPTRFALASVHNTFFFPNEMKKLLQTLGVSTTTVQTDDNCVTFAGNYLQRFSIANLQFIHPEKQARMWIKGMQAAFWLQLEVPHIQGEMDVNDFSFANKKNAFSLSGVQLRLDQHSTLSGLWVGKMDWNIAGIRWKAKSIPPVILSGIHVSSDLHESGGKLWSKPRLKIDKIAMDAQAAGPISLQITARKLNAQALLNIAAVFESVLQRGELYHSELWQRVSFILPTLMAPGASVKVDKFEFVTETGSIQIKAGILWPNKDILPANDMLEMMDNGRVYAKARASKTFVSQVIGILSGLSLFREVPEQALDELSGMENDATSAMQRNAFLLASLVDANELSENDAEQLVGLLRDEPVGDQYPDKVKQLFLTKAISQETTYLLYWNMVAIQQLVISYRQQVAQYQYVISQQLSNQFDDWIKQGFIKENDKDYSVSMTREEGVLTVNGKKI